MLLDIFTYFCYGYTVTTIVSFIVLIILALYSDYKKRRNERAIRHLLTESNEY